MIYLDGHSTTPLDPLVFEAMKPYFLERFGNASHGLHRYNWEAQAAVEHARIQVSRLLGVHEKELIFTGSATEANHLAILGLAGNLQAANRKRILSLRIEHASVLGALELMSERGFAVEFIHLDRDGRVDLEDLGRKLTSDVGLVTLATANHEVGTLQEMKRISEQVHASGALLHTDAVQALGRIPFTADSLGADLITLSSHKIHGPKGAGALYVRRKNPRVELEPVFLGGGQERGLRPGTPDTPAIVGFGMAAEIIHARRELETRELSRLRDLLWKLLNEGIPGLVRNGMKDGGLPHNLNVSVPGVDGAALYGRLKDVAVSNASACLNGVQDYSEVLTVLGVGKALARATLRFGLGRFNSEEEIRTAAKEVVAVVNELRRMEKEFAEQTGIPYDSWEKP